MTISWVPQMIAEKRLDEYEVFRDRRRDRTALFLPTAARMQRLLSEGYTREEIMQAASECEKCEDGSKDRAA